MAINQADPAATGLHRPPRRTRGTGRHAPRPSRTRSGSKLPASHRGRWSKLRPLIAGAGRSCEASRGGRWSKLRPLVSGAGSQIGAAHSGARRSSGPARHVGGHPGKPCPVPAKGNAVGVGALGAAFGRTRPPRRPRVPPFISAPPLRTAGRRSAAKGRLRFACPAAAAAVSKASGVRRPLPGFPALWHPPRSMPAALRSGAAWGRNPASVSPTLRATERREPCSAVRGTPRRRGPPLVPRPQNGRGPGHPGGFSGGRARCAASHGCPQRRCPPPCSAVSRLSLGPFDGAIRAGWHYGPAIECGAGPPRPGQTGRGGRVGKGPLHTERATGCPCATPHNSQDEISGSGSAGLRAAASRRHSRRRPLLSRFQPIYHAAIRGAPRPAQARHEPPGIPRHPRRAAAASCGAERRPLSRLAKLPGPGWSGNHGSASQGRFAPPAAAPLRSALDRLRRMGHAQPGHGANRHANQPPSRSRPPRRPSAATRSVPSPRQPPHRNPRAGHRHPPCNAANRGGHPATAPAALARPDTGRKRTPRNPHNAKRRAAPGLCANRACPIRTPRTARRLRLQATGPTGDEQPQPVQNRPDGLNLSSPAEVTRGHLPRMNTASNGVPSNVSFQVSRLLCC